MTAAFTDTFIKNLSTPGRYTDPATPGLNLQVKPNRGKYWTLRYVRSGTRQDLSLGAYPTVTLKQARVRAVDLRAQLNKGQLPSPSWRSAAEKEVAPVEPVLFKNYAAECIAAKRPEWRNTKHAAQWSSSIELLSKGWAEASG